MSEYRGAVFAGCDVTGDITTNVRNTEKARIDTQIYSVVFIH
jgi:hypothetical protein